MNSIRKRIITAFADRVSAQINNPSAVVSVFVSNGRLMLESYDSIRDSISLSVHARTNVDATDIFLSSSDLLEQQDNLISEIICAATASDRTLGGLCDDITETGYEFGERESGARTVSVQVDFVIEYSYFRGNPFSKSSRS